MKVNSYCDLCFLINTLQFLKNGSPLKTTITALLNVISRYVGRNKEGSAPILAWVVLDYFMQGPTASTFFCSKLCAK